MQELDPAVFLAVFQEMLGPWLWVIFAVVVVGLVAFVALLIRERRPVARRIVWSQLLGLLGGVVTLIIMVRVSSSGFTDAGGPIDWLVIALVFVVGAVATAILAYTLIGWAKQLRKPNASLATSGA